jgi:hypothetical protein
VFVVLIYNHHTPTVLVVNPVVVDAQIRKHVFPPVELPLFIPKDSNEAPFGYDTLKLAVLVNAETPYTKLLFVSVVATKARDAAPHT